MQTRRRTAVGIGGAALGVAALSLSMAMPAQADTYAQGVVRANGGLVAHQAPSTHAPRTGGLTNGTQFAIDCVTKGTGVQGDRDWYLVSGEGTARWVSGTYVDVVDGTPRHCGPAVSISATTNKATGGYEGPTRADLYYESLNKGVTTEVQCSTVTGPAKDQQRWVVTRENAMWIPRKDLKTTAHIPYCQQL